MYNDEIHLIHNPNARGRAPRYKVIKKDVTTTPKGVTTIIGKVLAKDLISWAIDACVSYLKEKLPVITEEDLQVAAVEHERLRDSGASTGTEAHALVESYLKGNPVTLDKVSQEAQNAYNAFVEWFESEEPEVVNVEEVIYSDKYGYAGTYDCLLKIDGKYWLCDLKTTNASRRAPNGVYPENFIQLGAYALAHEEQRTFEDTNGGTKLVKVDGLMVISAKKNGKLDIVTNEDLKLTVEECSDMFKRVHDLYKFVDYATKLFGGK